MVLHLFEHMQLDEEIISMLRSFYDGLGAWIVDGNYAAEDAIEWAELVGVAAHGAHRLAVGLAEGLAVRSGLFCFD